MWRLFVLLILVTDVIGDSCVRFTFEEDNFELFNHGMCAWWPTVASWDIGRFTDTDLTNPNELSTKFIYPGQASSCGSTSMFTMQHGGTIEINIFMHDTSNADVIEVYAMKENSDGGLEYVGYAANMVADEAVYVRGWLTMTISVNWPADATSTFTGYITFIGSANTNSLVLVDSFRYIPPGMDESECILYQPESSSTTETTSASETTTESIPTTETLTTKLTTIDLASTEQSTTEQPTTLPVSDDSDDSFWTQRRIIIISALLSLIILFVLCSICFCCRSKPVSVVVVKA